MWIYFFKKKLHPNGWWMRWFIAGIATEQYIFIDKFCRILSNQKLKKVSSTHTGEYSNTPCLPMFLGHLIENIYCMYIYIYYIWLYMYHVCTSIWICSYTYIYIHIFLWCYPCTHALCFRSLSLKEWTPAGLFASGQVRNGDLEYCYKYKDETRPWLGSVLSTRHRLELTSFVKEEQLEL